MTVEQTDSPQAAQRRRETRHWYHVHQSGRRLSARRWQEWRLWLADSENGAEYNRLIQMYDLCRSSPEPGSPTTVELRATAPADPVALRRFLPKADRWRGLKESLQAIRELWPQWRRPFLFALITGVVAFAVIPFASQRPESLPGNGLYGATSGEHRQFPLPDGSMLTLDGSAAVRFSMSARERSAVLEYGVAIFEVSHNPALPFHVYAGTGRTTALGTSFCVQNFSDQVVVKVLAGAVVIDPREQIDTPGWTSIFRPADAGQPTPLKVTHGNELTYDVRGAAGAVQPTDSRSVTALLDAPLKFRHRPLQEVVDDVQHYSTRHIDVDPAAGKLPFTGVIGRESIDLWVRGLHEIMPVEVVDSDHNHLRVRVISPSVNTDP